MPAWCLQLSPQLVSVCWPAGEACTLSRSLCAWLLIFAEDRPTNLLISWTSYMTLFATQHFLEPLEASLWAWMRALLRPLASAGRLSTTAWSLPDSFMTHHVHVAHGTAVCQLHELLSRRPRLLSLLQKSGSFCKLSVGHKAVCHTCWAALIAAAPTPCSSRHRASVRLPAGLLGGGPLQQAQQQALHCC